MENKALAWRDVVGYEGIYKVSIYGDVYSCFTRKYLKPNTDKFGYQSVMLYKMGVKKRKLIHRLTALTFIQNFDSKGEVNHKDGIKSNNFVSNLEWATRSENAVHAYSTGLIVIPKGKDDKRSKAVAQYDLAGNIITTWESLSLAAKGIGVSSSGNISDVANGKRLKAKGFIWKFI